MLVSWFLQGSKNHATIRIAAHLGVMLIFRTETIQTEY